jgi:hypothetical protein
MGSLSMTCDPVGSDGVEITAQSVWLQHYIYMLMRKGWMGWEGEIFRCSDHQKHGPGGQQGVDVVDGGITWNTLNRSLFGAARTRRRPPRPLRFTAPK